MQNSSIERVSTFLAVDGGNKIKHKGDLLNFSRNNQATRAAEPSRVCQGDLIDHEVSG